MKEYYSIDDVAVMTMLSTRTIRNYIKSGFLVGDKSSGNWRFIPENIGQFLENKNVKPSILAKRNGIVYDFISENKKNEDKVCSIYDYLVENSTEADVICKNMLELVNAEVYEGIQFSYQYVQKNKMVRVIIAGNTKLVTELVKVFYERRHLTNKGKIQVILPEDNLSKNTTLN